MGMKLGERYANAIHQLLPKGIAWQDKGICTETLLGRWIRGNSEELARFQVWFDTLLKWSIERYAEMPTGWSAEEYEVLIKRKFGLNVTVTPSASINDPHIPNVSPRNRYRFTIEVDEADLGAIDSLLADYLDEYKQSHTNYVIKATAQASVATPASAGIMAIKFDQWDGLHVGGTTSINNGAGVLVTATQAFTPIITKANTLLSNGLDVFVLARQLDQPVVVKTNNKIPAGMNVFAYATG